MTKKTPIDRIEMVRNSLATLLVVAFIGAMVSFTWRVIPEANKDIITYMVGQLSGMATTALGFYFINKVGQDAIDAKRADNTGKLAEAVTAAIAAPAAGAPTGAADDPLSVVGAESTVDAEPVKTETKS